MAIRWLRSWFRGSHGGPSPNPSPVRVPRRAWLRVEGLEDRLLLAGNVVVATDDVAQLDPVPGAFYTFIDVAANDTLDGQSLQGRFTGGNGVLEVLNQGEAEVGLTAG